MAVRRRSSRAGAEELELAGNAILATAPAAFPAGGNARN